MQPAEGLEVFRGLRCFGGDSRACAREPHGAHSAAGVDVWDDVVDSVVELPSS